MEYENDLESLTIDSDTQSELYTKLDIESDDIESNLENINDSDLESDLDIVEDKYFRGNS